MRETFNPPNLPDTYHYTPSREKSSLPSLDYISINISEGHHQPQITYGDKKNLVVHPGIISINRLVVDYTIRSFQFRKCSLDAP